MSILIQAYSGLFLCVFFHSFDYLERAALLADAAESASVLKFQFEAAVFLVFDNFDKGPFRVEHFEIRERAREAARPAA